MMTWHSLLFFLVPYILANSPTIEPKYKVVLLGHSSISEDILSRTMPMTNADGEEYLCVLPEEPQKDEEPSGTMEGPAPRNIRGRPEHRALHAQIILSKALGKDNCFLKLTGWWSYEYCFDKWLRQYHQDAQEVIKDQFFLGFGKDSLEPNADGMVGEESSADGKFTFGKDEDGPYFSTLFLNGTVCDLTGQQRQTETRFYCSFNSPHPNNFFKIEEPSTCEYLTKFYTASLCYMEEFKTVDDPAENIKCYKQTEDTAVSPENLGADPHPTQQADEEEPVEPSLNQPVPDPSTEVDDEVDDTEEEGQTEWEEAEPDPGYEAEAGEGLDNAEQAPQKDEL